MPGSLPSATAKHPDEDAGHESAGAFLCAAPVPPATDGDDSHDLWPAFLGGVRLHPSDDPSTAAPEPRTGHLHGLGLDPADGTVYAGGHLGVFRLTGSEAVRVANRCQDTMGFTVTGPRTFLASGHPSATDRTATSPHLGLIRSTDAGNTWTTVSAEGRADFHSLQSAGDMLYGFDSQTCQVWASSDGGATWDRRAQLPIGDLAAHASKPQQLSATTPDGLRTSVDGGHTFTPVPDVPDLVAIDSPDSGVLVALGADGQVLVGDDGRAWTHAAGCRRTRSRRCWLAAVSSAQLFAADTGDVVYESQDGGRSWQVLHRPGAVANNH
ncbi:F510_1955 family glycosylhydrolase [Streptomyces sp. 5K101]|uniref:F510_1955 family glycosylhydrolase n=1 Tax=Streptomyces sp. 5K101 TaxID=3390037 RepID=UPI0039767291